MKQGCFEQKVTKVTKGTGEGRNPRGTRSVSAFVVQLDTDLIRTTNVENLRVARRFFEGDDHAEARRRGAVNQTIVLAAPWRASA